MNLQELYFQWPQAQLLMLGEIVILALVWYLYRFRETQLQAYADPKLLSSLSLPRSFFGYWAKAVALGLIWALITLSIMQPMGLGEYPKELSLHRDERTTAGRQRAPQEVILLLDASASMSIKDMPEKSTRFDYSKQAADQILSRLTGEQVASYAFTSEAISLSPLTTDYLFTRLILRLLQEGESGTSGTDLYQTLSTIRSEFFVESQRTVPKTIVLLSDGGDTLLETEGSKARQKREEEILKLLNEAELNKVRVLVIGLGSMQGASVPGVMYQNQPVISKVEEAFLRKLALAGRGRYFEAEKSSVMDLAEAVVAEISRDRRYIEGEVQGDNRDLLIHPLYFQIPLGIAILLLLFYLLYPETSHLIWLLFLFVPQLNSAEEAALLHQAQSYYEVQEAPLALQIYKKALQSEGSAEKRAVLLYNIGTSYLATKEWKKALDTLKTVPLSDNPSPVLRYQTKGNLAFAYLKSSLFKQALEELQSAREAKCTLDQAMGFANCPVDPWLDWLQKAIEEAINQPQSKQTGEEPATESQKEKTQKTPVEAIPLLLEMAQQDMTPLMIVPAKKDPRPW